MNKACIGDESLPLSDFKKALNSARDTRPVLMLIGLRGLMSVVCHQEPMDYQTYCEKNNLAQVSGSIQIGLLSDGRGKSKGADLLIRIKGRDRRMKCVIPSEAGLEFIQDMLDASGLSLMELQKAIIEFDKFCPGISLGAACIYLEIAERIGLNGAKPILGRDISTNIKISNYPRHISALSSGSHGRQGQGLIKVTCAPENRITRHLRMTERGSKLHADLVKALVGSDELEPQFDTHNQNVSEEDLSLQPQP